MISEFYEKKFGEWIEQRGTNYTLERSRFERDPRRSAPWEGIVSECLNKLHECGASLVTTELIRWKVADFLEQVERMEKQRRSEP